jgi:signal transduction histidine kinase
MSRRATVIRFLADGRPVRAAAGLIARAAGFMALAGVILAAGAADRATAGVPELMERSVLPVTPALPTSACLVRQGSRDQLVVGLENGEVVAFHETAGDVLARTGRLGRAAPVEAVLACRELRPGGSGTEFVVFAVQGRRLCSLAFEDMSVSRCFDLPRPSGSYRLAKVRQGAAGSADRGFDRVVIYDDDSMMRIIVDARSRPPTLGVESVLEGADDLTVTVLSDRIVAATRERVVEFLPSAEGISRAVVRHGATPKGPVSRVAAGPVADGGLTLRLLSLIADSVWTEREVGLPGPCAVVESVSDTLLAAGGTVAMTPSHEIGWVALVNGRGEIVAGSGHASPVTSIERCGDFVAVQGDGRNLSVYDRHLNSLWDHNSPVDAVELLAGDFAGDAAPDLAVVGIRDFVLAAAQVDSIRKYLDEPDFMAGATTADGIYRLRRSFITYLVSNELELRQTLLGGLREAADAFAAGDSELAVEHAMLARGAAAVIGWRSAAAEISGQMAEYASFPRRRRALVVSAALLAVLGLWVSVERARGTASLTTTALAAVALVGSAAVAWRVLGDARWNPVLLVGSGFAVGALVLTRRPAARSKRVPGAAIEDLIRTLMEFLHGGGEGVPSEGVVDAARKSVTKVAYLAQELLDSSDDEERFAMLRERLRARADDFINTTHQRAAFLLAQARRAGFIEHEAGLITGAADRIRDGLTTALAEPAPDQAVVRHCLESIRDARDVFAAAADRAWAIVQSNPGCSLVRSLDRILREKEDELHDAGVVVVREDGVPAERDAVALWSFEFRFILENLVANALRAMEGRDRRVLTVETSTDGDTCSVRISDTGSGMDEDTRRALFDAKEDERGGGFGMPNTRLRLRECGGDVVVERAAPGEGTTFLLTIPHWTADTGDF